MKKIETLTPEQIAKFPLYRERWIKIGLAEEVKGFDKIKSESAIREVYKSAKLDEPKTFIWVESPLHAGVCYALMKNKKLDSVGDSVRDSVRASVRASVLDSVRASVRASVLASVRASVWASVRDSVRASVGDSVGDSVWDSVRASCYGCHDASWLSFYKYFNDECGIDCAKLSGLWQAAENCGWFIPFENLVIVSPRPYSVKTKINSRGNHELHADGVPAIYYCDDFKIYANGGTRIPEKYGAIPIKDWQSKWLLEEKNAELKRCLIQNIGYDKIAQELSAQTLDTWNDEGRGGRYDLVRIPNEVDVEPIFLCKMSCPSTGAPYMIRVPPEIKTAYEAITWIRHGYKPEEFICQH